MGNGDRSGVATPVFINGLDQITSSGGGGGGVDAVVAGANITVNSTDPANPVVGVTNNVSLSGTLNVDGKSDLAVTEIHDALTVDGAAEFTSPVTFDTNVEIDGNIVFSGSTVTGLVQQVHAGTNVTIGGTASNPVINATGGGGGGTVDSVVAGANIAVDSTDPANPIVAVSATPSFTGVTTTTGAVNLGTGTLSKTSGAINLGSGTIDTSGLLTLSGGITLSAGTVTGLVQSLTAGTNVTIGGTASNPVINASGGGGGVTSITAGSNITVDNTIPSAPVVALTTNPTFTGTITQTGTGAVDFTGTVDFGRGTSAITVSNNGTVNLGSGLVTVGNNMVVGNQVNIGGGNIVLQGSSATFLAATTFDTNVTVTDSHNIVFGLSTGTKIGNATTNKLAFWGRNPQIQPVPAGITTGMTANTGTPVLQGSTFDGSFGSTVYTVGDLVQILKLIGLIAM